MKNLISVGIIITCIFIGNLTYSKISKKGSKKVIIIGAGISGLAAAEKLKKAGMDVLVLEAASKIGGRINTDTSLNIPFERGASWIHGVHKNPITALSKTSGNSLYETKFNEQTMVIYNDQGIKFNKKQIEDAEEIYARMLDDIEDSNNNDNMQKFLDRHYQKEIKNPLIRFFLSIYTVFDTGGLDKLSARYINHGSEFKGEDALILNGYENILKSMHHKLDIKYNSRVSSINYENSEIIVSTDKTNFSADMVLVTVPLGVLKQKKIQFSPELPEYKNQAIQNIGFNIVDKFLLIWDRVFWDDKLFIGQTKSQLPDNQFNLFVNINHIDKKAPALMTFAFDTNAQKISTLTDLEVIQEVMGAIKKMYPNAPNPISFLRTDYSKDINFYGSYSFMHVNTRPSDFKEMAKNINNKIFFAGEHTSPQYFSTTHGAYLSGLRVADEIIPLK